MNREFKGVWFPKEVWLDNRLSALDKIILLEIDSLDYEEKGCYAGNEYLAEFCQCSERKITESISKLTELNYIYLESFDGRTRVLRSTLSNNAKQTSKNCEAETQNIPQIILNKNTNKKNNFNNINTKKEIEKEKPVIKDGYSMTDEEIDDIFGITHEEENKLEEKPKTDSEKVFDYYVMKSKFYGYIKRDLKETDVILNNIKKILKEYDLLYIEQTIDRYFQVISDKNYYFDTYWKPELFFKQKNAFLEFTEEGSKWINYNLAKNKVNPYKS